MNISPFYELRKRLYNSAAAGCSAVNEDFRLKKAADDFAPLAQANKAFARLGEMTSKLFEMQDPAPVLADCIALADALAVAQGTFSDNSETVLSSSEKKEDSSSYIPYSVLNGLRDKILRCSPKLEELSPDELKLASDPRILSAFITAADKNNYSLDRFSEIIIKTYRNSLVPLLKNRIDLTNEKETGARVKYIRMTAGTAENDYYISLAENAEAPQNVRIAAIEAMGDSVENSAKLAELYKTEKGKIKNAALMSLAGIDCPETEEIFGKLLTKYKKSYAPYIARSCGETCTKFAIDEIKRTTLASGYLTKDGRNSHELFDLLANKPNADEGFILLKNHGTNGILIQNLENKNRREEFENLIHRLYEKDKEAFFKAEFFVRLMNDADAVFVDMKDDIDAHKDDVSAVLESIYYDIFAGCYCIIRNGWVYSREKIFNEIPQGALDFLASDCDDWKELDRRGEVFLRILHKNEYNKNDMEKVRNSAVKFAVNTLKKYIVRSSMKIVSEYYKDAPAEFYLDLIKRDVTEHMTVGYGLTVFFDEDNFPVSREDTIKAYSELLSMINTLEAGMSEEEKNKNRLAFRYNRSRIEKILEKFGEYGGRK